MLTRVIFFGGGVLSSELPGRRFSPPTPLPTPPCLLIFPSLSLSPSHFLLSPVSPWLALPTWRPFFLDHGFSVLPAQKPLLHRLNNTQPSKAPNRKSRRNYIHIVRNTITRYCFLVSNLFCFN